MRVKELIELLQNMPQDALVIQSKDSEGNVYKPVDDISLGRYRAETYWYGEFGLDCLTEIHREQGYTEEDVIEGPLAVCIWPIN